MMGILIKGTEMPKNCGECLFKHLSPTGESIVCELDLSTVPWDERPFDCPLVPVPPHGRLIDADKMKESIRKQAGFLKLMGGKMAEIAEVLEEGILQEIDNAPTIIEAEADDD